MTTQRERFEAFATAPNWRGLDVSKSGDGYNSAETKIAWLAWQEAERQMIERCANKADYYAGGSSDAWVIADEIRALGA